MDFFNLKKPTVLLGVPKGAAAIHINSTTTHCIGMQYLKNQIKIFYQCQTKSKHT